jgi:serine/threonine protein kinase
MTAPPSKDNLRKAGKSYAEKTINKTFEKSKILDNADDFPQFSKEEITLGKVLGKGGFGTVYEVRGFEAGKHKVPLRTRKTATTVDDDDETFGSENGVESRKFIADHCIRSGGDARYAAKLLSPEVIDDLAIFIQGIMDMATETRVLSDISHPNIIRMRACASVTPYDEKYFIVMDRLYDTMEGRIIKWCRKVKQNSSFLGKIVLDRKGDKRKSILEEKLVAGFDLSAAIGYMHDRKILYRDLKPENIGFDIVSIGKFNVVTTN